MVQEGSGDSSPSSGYSTAGVVDLVGVPHTVERGGREPVELRIVRVGHGQWSTGATEQPYLKRMAM